MLPVLAGHGLIKQRAPIALIEAPALFPVLARHRA